MTASNRAFIGDHLRFRLSPIEAIVLILPNLNRRCLRCNHPLQPVSKEDILDRLEPLTRRYYDEFHRCPACDQIYWKGSHYEKMMEFVARVTGESTL